MDLLLIADASKPFRAPTAASAALEAARASAMAASRLGQKAKDSQSLCELVDDCMGDSVRDPGTGGDGRGDVVEAVDAADGLPPASFRKLMTPADALSAFATA